LYFGVAQSFVVYIVFCPPEGRNNGGQNTIKTTKDWATPNNNDQERRGK
jgi:hypothetical protein